MTKFSEPHELDEVLRQAFRPVDPPAGFADRVVRRASQAKVGTSVGGAAWFRWAAAAVLVVGASGGLWYRAEERRRTAGEEARRQVLISLQIAGSKLNAVQMKINRHQESGQ